MSDFLEVLSRKSLKRHRSEDYAQRKVQRKKFKEEKNLRKLEKNIMKKKTPAKEETKAEEEIKDEKTSGRDYTISIALPGSILDNAQSPELRTYLAGQIARHCVIFQVCEVIFDLKFCSLTLLRHDIYLGLYCIISLFIHLTSFPNYIVGLSRL